MPTTPEVKSVFGTKRNLPTIGAEEASKKVKLSSDVAMKEKTIDPKGDLFLIVSKKTKLRVSTKILSLTSSVFEAMLGPRFAEGQQSFTFSSPGSVELPEDDPAAMEALCDMLHMRFAPKFLTSLTWLNTLGVAKLADKYQCTVAITPGMTQCFYRFMEKQESIPTVELLAMAYLMGYAEEFRKVSKMIS